jgi:nicotinate-nucleotide adenylyltransferase
VRLLLLGGSFNPVHIGHLLMAQDIRAQFGYDLVLLVPSLKPPHKSLIEDPGPEHRLAMLRLALAGDGAMAVDDCEIRRGGTSYTIDTVRDVGRRYAIEGKLGLILGDDLVPGFATWRDPEPLVREADIICAHRAHAERLPFPFAHQYADNLLVPVSSSLVRSRIAEGRPFRYLVPATVHDYIIEERLYGLP